MTRCRQAKILYVHSSSVPIQAVNVVFAVRVLACVGYSIHRRPHDGPHYRGGTPYGTFFNDVESTRFSEIVHRRTEAPWWFLTTYRCPRGISGDPLRTPLEPSTRDVKTPCRIPFHLPTRFLRRCVIRDLYSPWVQLRITSPNDPLSVSSKRVVGAQRLIIGAKGNERRWWRFRCKKTSWCVRL